MKRIKQNKLFRYWLVCSGKFACGTHVTYDWPIFMFAFHTSFNHLCFILSDLLGISRGTAVSDKNSLKCQLHDRHL